MRQNLQDGSGKLLGWRQQVGRQIRGYALMDRLRVGSIPR